MLDTETKWDPVRITIITIRLKVYNLETLMRSIIRLDFMFSATFGSQFSKKIMVCTYCTTLEKIINFKNTKSSFIQHRFRISAVRHLEMNKMLMKPYDRITITAGIKPDILSLLITFQLVSLLLSHVLLKSPDTDEKVGVQ